MDTGEQWWAVPTLRLLGSPVLALIGRVEPVSGTA